MELRDVPNPQASALYDIVTKHEEICSPIGCASSRRRSPAASI